MAIKFPEDGEFEQMGRDTITRLVPTKSDADLAQEFKQKIIEAHEPMLKVLTEIDRAGFRVQVSTGKNALGHMVIAQLELMKMY